MVIVFLENHQCPLKGTLEVEGNSQLAKTHWEAVSFGSVEIEGWRNLHLGRILWK
jgi:hypothetical protein